MHFSRLCSAISAKVSIKKTQSHAKSSAPMLCHGVSINKHRGAHGTQQALLFKRWDMHNRLHVNIKLQ